MKKEFPAILFFLFSMAANAQPNAELQSLINAEKAFAQTSKDSSTKAAFSSFMSDSGLIFQSGPVLGKQFWQQAAQGPELLSWEPAFVSLAASQDFGYSTGPWEFRSRRDDVRPAGTGYFVSIWQKEKDIWKVLLDIGVSFPPAAGQKEDFTFHSLSAIAPTGETEVSTDLLHIEQQFINEQATNNWTAYRQFIAEDARIYRPGSFPYVTTDQKKQLFQESDKKISYEKIAAKMAPSNDLGCIYGKAIIEITKDGSVRRLTGNYVRIWRKEKTAEWKIVLDLVNVNR